VLKDACRDSLVCMFNGEEEEQLICSRGEQSLSGGRGHGQKGEGERGEVNRH
jgi:hypothetical protein